MTSFSSTAARRPRFRGVARLALALQIASAAFGALSVSADPVRGVSYEEFEALVRDSASKIPDLESLWRWQAKFNEPVYFGGGALRGLLRWLEENLRTHSPEEVRQLRVPSVSELLIVKNSDRDLYHDKVGKQWFAQNLPEYGSWDILTKKFYDASVSAGGPPIEKIRVNPRELQDPLGGLRQFYEGKLSFVASSELVFKRYRGKNATELTENFKIALILRTLRFSQDLPSVELEETAFRQFRRIAAYEAKMLKPDNYWVAKALRKLYAATGDSTEKTVDLLRRSGLLTVLAAKNYDLIKADAFAERIPLVQFLEPGEATEALVGQLKKASRDVETIVFAMEKTLAQVRSASEFVTVLSYGLENPSDAYKRAVSDVLKRNVDAFVALNPTVDEVNRAKALSTTVETSIALMDRAIDRSLGADHFIALLAPGVKTPSEAYVAAIEGLIRAKLGVFARLGPSTQQWNLLKGKSGSIQTCIAIAEAALARAKTPRQFWAALQPGIKNPNENYLAALRRLTATNSTRFLDLGPSDAEIDEYLKNVGSEANGSIVAEMQQAKGKTTMASRLLNRTVAYCRDLLKNPG